MFTDIRHLDNVGVEQKIAVVSRIQADILGVSMFSTCGTGNGKKHDGI
jgi:hypothetical protein